MPIRQVNFKTSIETGTRQSSSTGQNLAKLLLGGAEIANKFSKEYKSQQENQRVMDARSEKEKAKTSKLVLNDAIIEYNKMHANFIEENPNPTSTDWEGFYDTVVETQQSKVESLTELDLDAYQKFHSSKQVDLAKLKALEIKQADGNFINERFNAGVSSMQEIDDIIEVQDSFKKSDILESWIASSYNKVSSNLEAYAGKTKKDLISEFGLMNKNTGIKNQNMNGYAKFDKLINEIDLSTRKTNSVSTAITNIVSGNKGYANAIVDAYRDNNIDVFSSADVDKEIKEQIKLNAFTNENVAIKLSIESGNKIEAYDSEASNLINTAKVNPEKAFKNYTKFKERSSKGYAYNQKNNEMIEDIEFIANAYGVSIGSAQDFESVANMYEQGKNNPIQYDKKKFMKLVEDEELSLSAIQNAMRLTKLTGDYEGAIARARDHEKTTTFNGINFYGTNIKTQEDADKIVGIINKNRGFNIEQVQRINDTFSFVDENGDQFLMNTNQINSILKNDKTKDIDSALEDRYNKEEKARGYYDKELKKFIPYDNEKAGSNIEKIKSTKDKNGFIDLKIGGTDTIINRDGTKKENKFTSDYKNVIMQEENSKSATRNLAFGRGRDKVFSDGMHYAFFDTMDKDANSKSQTPTIGYGYKLSKEEFMNKEVVIDGEKVDITNGITDEQASKLFETSFNKKGLEPASKQYNDLIKDASYNVKYKKFDDMPEEYKTIMAEVMFNAGSSKWKSLIEAFNADSLEDIKKQIMRKAGGKPLTKRVDALRNAIDKNIKD